MPNAKITTLTPVHVGSGTTYCRNLDFVEEGGRVGIVDPNKVASLIGTDEKAITEWTNAINKGENLLQFLRNGRGLRSTKLEDISERICRTEDTRQPASNLKEQYRTTLKGAAIPGTSLKGAIKTAVWDNLASDDFLKQLNASDLKNRKGKWDDSTVDSKLFGNNANEKSTRFLKVGDIHFESVETKVYEVRVLNAYTHEWKFKSGSNFFEAIPAGKSAEFTFKIDDILLKRNEERDTKGLWPAHKIDFLRKGIGNLSSLINDYSLTQLEWEIEALDEERIGKTDAGQTLLEEYERICTIIDDCKEGEFVIRVGGHSGWIFTTGGWIRNSSLSISAQEMKFLRKTIQKGKDYDMTLWPKTRKTTPEGRVFGFVKVEI